MRRERSTSGPDDRDRLEHMKNGASAAARFVQGRSRPDLESDDQTRRALVNAVQEIGEAAARVSDVGRAKLPSLPWGQIVAMRHVLVHVYWGVDNDQLWLTATVDIPVLLEAVESVLSAWPEE